VASAVVTIKAAGYEGPPDGVCYGAGWDANGWHAEELWTSEAEKVQNGCHDISHVTVSWKCKCEPEPIYGCTDPDALNYDPNATEDDGSCEYPPPPPEDVCPNIEGEQETVPEGMIIDKNGNCVMPPVVPPTFYEGANKCQVEVEGPAPAETYTVYYNGVELEGYRGARVDTGEAGKWKVTLYRGTTFPVDILVGAYWLRGVDENCDVTPAAPAEDCNQVYAVRGATTTWVAATCDPWLVLMVDGKVAYKDEHFGNERIAVATSWESLVEIYLNGNLWGYFGPSSAVLVVQ
jgi:hypothetical protein